MAAEDSSFEAEFLLGILEFYEAQDASFEMEFYDAQDAEFEIGGPGEPQPQEAEGREKEEPREEEGPRG